MFIAPPRRGAGPPPDGQEAQHALSMADFILESSPPLVAIEAAQLLAREVRRLHDAIRIIDDDEDRFQELEGHVEYLRQKVATLQAGGGVR